MNRENLQTVLYVDDEPDIREVVELSLGLVGGLTVHTCESGERALEVLPILQPDLILLDVMMPRLDGPSTLQRLRADPRSARIPVVFMTAKAMPQEVERFKQLGAVAVIAKPFDPMRLGEQVISIWEGLTGE
ncbi:MAG TPA: response regulator [Steroidobacteraceae bacterium]|nr:response regulator [Steroidobacteraceae bacterium]